MSNNTYTGYNLGPEGFEVVHYDESKSPNHNRTIAGLPMKDMVNHPEHYQSNKGFEVIDVIEAYTEGLNGIEATDTGNIIKYACRWKSKNGLEDLKKIRWYVNHLIDHLEGNPKIHERKRMGL